MRKRYSAKQKAQIALEMLKEERTVAQIASEYGVHPNQLYKWKALAQAGLPEVFDTERKNEKALKTAHENQLQELYAEIGRLNTQLNWIKKKSGLELLEN